mgnify:CR=1 FL=1
MIKYKVGDVTNPEPPAHGVTIIVHCCNDIGVMGGGVALALAKKWPGVYDEYDRWYADDHYHDRDSLPYRHQHDPFVLGQIQLVNVDPNSEVWVCNLIGQRDVQPYLGLPPVRYEAIREGLRRLANKLTRSAKYPPSNFNIVMPRIASGLAGGSWQAVEPIIQEELKDFDITVYDIIPVDGTNYDE